ncbi:class I SAM-dependent methyltransferase [Planctomycetota bacterium]
MTSQLRFLRRMLVNFRTLGAVSPSSRFLARAMCRQINWTDTRTILEVGPGTGIFTVEILRRMPDGARLILLEKDPVLYQGLKSEFPQVTVLNGDVRDLDTILNTMGINQLDAVISGLPILLFPKDVTRHFAAAVHQRLSENGEFVQFTYRARKFKKITRDIFESVTIKKYVLLNLPPAFVLKLTTQPDLAAVPTANLS